MTDLFAQAVLTAEELRRQLHYDRSTGNFTWLIARGSVKPGARAGSPTGGYIRISVGSRLYAAHRLAWLYMTGEWPVKQVDHKDRNRKNNCWCNLRLATQGQNSANSNIRKDSISGLKGVRWHTHTRLWQARIMKDKHTHYLGYFLSAEEAFKAYCKAARELHGEFASVA